MSGDLSSDVCSSDLLYLLRILKLKIAIPEKAIEGDTMAINDITSVIGKFISDGIEILNCPSLKYAVVSVLNDKYYLDVLQLLRSLKLKIIFPNRLWILQYETVSISVKSPIVEKFISDGIEIFIE